MHCSRAALIVQCHEKLDGLIRIGEELPGGYR